MSTETKKTQPGFVERVAWLTGANLLAFSLSFFAPLTVVRKLDQSQFGIYKQLFQILATLIGILYLQVAASAFYFMERETDKRLQIAMNIILFYLMAGLLVVFACFVYPDWVTIIFHNSEIASYIPLLGLAVLTWVVSGNLDVIPLSLSDVRTTSIYVIFGQIAKSALIICAALTFQNVRAIIYASIAAGVVQTIFILIYIHRHFGSLWRAPWKLVDWPLFKKQMANSLPFGGGSLANSLQSDLHNYFVSFYFPPALFAVYANGCFQMPLLNLLQASFREVLMPEVARLEAAGDYPGIGRAWMNAMRKLALLIVPACALMFVLRYEMITTLFTKAYADSVSIFAIYLVNMLLLMFLTTSIMRSFPEFKYYRLKFNLALIPVSWGFLYVGIHAAGLIGAVIATVSVQTLDVVVSVSMIARRVGLKRHDLVHFAPVARTVAAALLAGVVTYLFRLAVISTHPLFILASCGICFGIFYVVTAFALGAITNEEKVELRARLQAMIQRFKPSRLGDVRT